MVSDRKNYGRNHTHSVWPHVLWCFFLLFCPRTLLRGTQCFRSVWSTTSNRNTQNYKWWEETVRLFCTLWSFVFCINCILWVILDTLKIVHGLNFLYWNKVIAYSSHFILSLVYSGDCCSSKESYRCRCWCFTSGHGLWIHLHHTGRCVCVSYWLWRTKLLWKVPEVSII